MRIVDKKPYTKVEVDVVCEGAIFRYNGGYYMKVSSLTLSDSSDSYVVNMANGYISTLQNTTMVEVVNCELVVE